MPTDDHLAWFILGVIAVLITHVVRDGVESFLKWRSERRGVGNAND